MDAITTPPAPVNEPNLTYAPGTPEREALVAELERQERRQPTLRAVVNGRRRNGGGAEMKVVQPHDHQHVLATFKNTTTKDAEAAVKAALDAAPAWRAMPFDERCAILLKAADLLAGPWRQRLNAATMLGQSKTAFQAEIDAACELIDFWRFNVHYARQILAEQPIANSPGIWNRTDHRPLEGFVYAITPFNFTAIAGNLPTAPALMGNTVIWKPSPTQQLAALADDGAARGGGHAAGRHQHAARRRPRRLQGRADPPRPGRHPLHRVDADLPAPVAHGRREHLRLPLLPADRRRDRRQGLRRRPPERRPRRAAGRRCCAAPSSSRARSARPPRARTSRSRSGPRCGTSSSADTDNLTMGDVTDFSNFMGAVIDDRAFAKHKKAIARVARNKHLTVVAGGQTDDSVGYFVRPTVVAVHRPDRPDVLRRVLRPDPRGPRLRRRPLRPGPRARWSRSRRTPSPARSSPRTGAAIADARRDLRFAAGNFYINDKPTGAVVGQQPFGGARASGTNDKAGAAQNLMRWTSPRSIKETFDPPKDHRYPYMG